MSISANFEGALKYERKKETYVLRIESDNFKICKPKIVRTQKYLVSEKTFIVHVKKKGKITYEPLN